jgi:gentisate 1,2-dioxygenase
VVRPCSGEAASFVEPHQWFLRRDDILVVPQWARHRVSAVSIMACMSEVSPSTRMQTRLDVEDESDGKDGAEPYEGFCFWERRFASTR